MTTAVLVLDVYVLVAGPSFAKAMKVILFTFQKVLDVLTLLFSLAVYTAVLCYEKPSRILTASTVFYLPMKVRISIWQVSFADMHTLQTAKATGQVLADIVGIWQLRTGTGTSLKRELDFDVRFRSVRESPELHR